MRKFLGLILSFVFFVPCFAFAKNLHTFMPENDLWREDGKFESVSKVNIFLFNQIISAGQKVYDPLAESNGERLKINRRWLDSTVNADACRGCEPGNVVVNMYGGMARRPEILPEGFALVMCHELSHTYGGTPYIDAENHMSAEGQADYGSTKECFRRVAALVPELQGAREPGTAVKKFCMQSYGTQANSAYRDCVNGLQGGLGLGRLLARLTGESAPAYETPDLTQVSETELSYPATVQCRLDTYLAGMLQRSRPRCWFRQ